MCTRKYSNTHTVMSLAVHAPTQFVSAESHASVCVHEQFIFFFNQRLLMRKKTKWTCQLQIKPVIQINSFYTHLVLCICEGLLAVFCHTVFRFSLTSESSCCLQFYVRCNHLFFSVAASSLHSVSMTTAYSTISIVIYWRPENTFCSYLTTVIVMS